MENIPKKLREGILKANNEATGIDVNIDYTTFISNRGKSRYLTDTVKSVAEYMGGRLPRDADPIMAIGYQLGKIKRVYNKLNEDVENPKTPEYPETPERLDYPEPD
jgi:hypothetical protein